MNEWTRRFRAWLLDRLIPPVQLEAADGPAFFAYAYHKIATINGLRVCPLIDPLIPLRAPRGHTNVVIGSVSGPEAVPSIQLPHRLNWLQFALSFLFLEKDDLANYRFVTRLYDSPELCRLNRSGRPHEFRWFRRLLALRCFLVARYFALKFRAIAATCDSAYVVVYYAAIMLGVVGAFRRLGKPVWDVQHGYLGPDHGAYNNRIAYSIPSSFRPSGFLVWERHFGQYVEATLGANWQSTDYAHLRSLESPSGSQRMEQIVLYSLQWATPVPAQVVAAVRHFQHVRWLFRMHPFDNSARADLDWIKDLPNATVVSASQPLSSALSACDLHLTYNSGVAHEAAALGIPTFFLDPQFAVRMTQETLTGSARLVREAELIAALDEFLAHENLPSLNQQDPKQQGCRA
jgi:hypothetical protein